MNLSLPDLIKDICTGIIVSLTILILGKVATQIIKMFMFPESEYSIKGYWYAKHGSDFNADLRAIEIYFFYQAGEKIKYRIEQYMSTDCKISHFCGGGIYRNSHGATYYYSTDKHSEQIGVLDFEVKKITAGKTFLQSTFREIEDRKPICNNSDSSDYRLYPIEISLVKRIYFKLPKKNSFKNYNEVKAFIDRNEQ